MYNRTLTCVGTRIAIWGIRVNWRQGYVKHIGRLALCPLLLTVPIIILEFLQIRWESSGQNIMKNLEFVVCVSNWTDYKSTALILIVFYHILYTPGIKPLITTYLKHPTWPHFCKKVLWLNCCNSNCHCSTISGEADFRKNVYKTITEDLTIHYS